MASNMPPSPNRPHIDKPALYCLYLLLFSISCLGHSLAYFGSWSSEYWWCVDGKYAWFLGMQRVLVVGLLSVFALRNMGFQTSTSSSSKISSLFPHKKLAYMVFAVSVLALPLVIYALGYNTIDNTTNDGPEECQILLKGAEFTQAWKPYFLYSLYVYALWGGMFVYFVYCVTSSAAYDRKWIRKNRVLLLAELAKETAREDTEAPRLDSVEMLFQSHAEAVHDIGQRYAVSMFVLVLALFHESFLAETVMRIPVYLTAGSDSI